MIDPETHAAYKAITAVDGDVISLSPLKSLTAGVRYRIEVKFTAGGNVFELYGQVNAEV